MWTSIRATRKSSRLVMRGVMPNLLTRIMCAAGDRPLARAGRVNKIQVLGIRGAVKGLVECRIR